eukprot:TRINITY_DN49694_c0_g1_i1.p1 TRINITY_DN49694_c0_g1~~TRINITY_DN49694_c0_g1_i1.p1  ORF type:complete len:269 (-),score=40.95 TRINITY_DN49694_c0_g1_i1:20-826(-)
MSGVARTCRAHSSGSQREPRQLIVSTISEGLVELFTDDYQSVTLPASLLPEDIEVGSIVVCDIKRSTDLEERRRLETIRLQERVAEYIRSSFGGLQDDTTIGPNPGSSTGDGRGGVCSTSASVAPGWESGDTSPSSEKTAQHVASFGLPTFGGLPEVEAPSMSPESLSPIANANPFSFIGGSASSNHGCASAGNSPAATPKQQGATQLAPVPSPVGAVMSPMAKHVTTSPSSRLPIPRLALNPVTATAASQNGVVRDFGLPSTFMGRQ